MPRRWPELGALLVATLASGACGGDGRELADAVAPLPPATTTTMPTVSSSLPPSPTIVTTAGSPSVGAGELLAPNVTIERLSSPEPGIAAAVGSGAISSDPVTVDGEAADVVAFDVSDDGSFEVRVFIADEGAHTVCILDVCDRVFTLDPDAETADEVIAKIDAAVPLAKGIAPIETWFPDWTIEIGGPMAGTGGVADSTTRTVVVYRNRGRSVDEFVRTILHEFGHVADATWMDDDGRAEFAALRGFAATTPWNGTGGHEMSDWAMSPSEDFAEVMVAVWSADRWDVRTDGGSLSAEVRDFAADLIDSNT
jgi:hypothetical protein